MDLILNKSITKLYVLNDSHYQVGMIRTEFAKTKPKNKVLKVEVIQNYYLWDFYKTSEDQLKERDGGQAP